LPKIGVSLAVIILLGLMLGACAHPENPVNPNELISQGEMLYIEYCAECHQPDGSGWSHLYPQLAGNPIVTLHDPEPIINTLVYGQGSMPSFQQKLNVDQAAAILSYIRNAWGNSASPVSPRQIH
jgi:mono/diheme cytochrome c family protein